MYSHLARMYRKLLGTFQRRKLDRDLAEELETHRSLVESDLEILRHGARKALPGLWGTSP
jgi:hypothetical protein